MAASGSGPVTRCIRRIRCPMDHLIMQPHDMGEVTTKIKSKDIAMVTWLFPTRELQRIMHKRYHAEAFHELVAAASPKDGDVKSEVNETLGLVTLLVGNNIPCSQSRLEKWLDPAPHPTLSLRVSVVDRIHWQRSLWLAGSICNSLFWGRIPKAVFSIALDWQKDVKIDAVFNEKTKMFDGKYTVTVPQHNFSLSLEDTGTTLLDPKTRTVEGFLDNESALKQLGLAREVNMKGLGNSVFRQTLWSTPVMPNVAKVVDVQCGSLFQQYFNCAEPVRVMDPVAAWLVDEVEETLIYKIEGHVEDENDPNSATTFGERSLVERVQKKAMNRYQDFRDDVRSKTVSDVEGREMPR